MKLKRRGVELRIILGGKNEIRRKVDPALLKAIARARRWFEEVASGRVPSLAAIAEEAMLKQSAAKRAAFGISRKVPNSSSITPFCPTCADEEQGHIGSANRWFAGTKHIDEIEAQPCLIRLRRGSGVPMLVACAQRNEKPATSAELEQLQR
jgi:hypothetical protein